MERTALITGGTGGLGRAVVAAFAAGGWRVVVPDVAPAELEDAEVVAADLTDPAEAARVVEIASARDLYTRPLHPYTEALLSAVPVPDPKMKRQRIMLQGDVPNPIRPPTGCPFHTRCPIRKLPLCSSETPPLKHSSHGHWVACHLRG